MLSDCSLSHCYDESGTTGLYKEEENFISGQWGMEGMGVLRKAPVQGEGDNILKDREGMDLSLWSIVAISLTFELFLHISGPNMAPGTW